MKNKIILALLLVCALTMPVFAKAITVDELKAQIASLQAQISQLIAQLAQIQGGGSTPWCHSFNTNLGIGSTGAEVNALHTVLSKEVITGDFGWGSDNFEEDTASYVVAFQEKYASEILKSYGLKHGTGYVGKSTRAKLNKLYGCGQPVNPQQPVSCVKEGEQGNYGFYNVCCNGLTAIGNNVLAATGNITVCSRSSAATFVCSACGNGVCGTGENSCNCPSDCKINATTTKSITVVSPNGGEVLTKGKTFSILWAADVPASTRLTIDTFNELGKVVADGLPAVLNNNGGVTWIVPTTIPDGKYKIRISICPASFSDPECMNKDLTPYGYDYSDNYFTIASSTSANLPPVIDGVTAPTQLKVNEQGTWQIKIHDPEEGPLTYVADWGDSSVGGGGGVLAPSVKNIVTQVASFNHSYSKAGTYTATFTITDDKNNSVKTSATVRVVIGDGTACTDSDGGKDYYIKGVAKDYFGTERPDICQVNLSNNSTTGVLFEAFCDSTNANNIVNYIPYTCPNGCSNGVCLPLESFTYNLQKGWNAISLPIQPTDLSLKAFLSRLPSTINYSFMAYDSANSNYKNVAVKSSTENYIDNLLLDINQNYIIVVDQQTSITIQGPAINKSIADWAKDVRDNAHKYLVGNTGASKNMFLVGFPFLNSTNPKAINDALAQSVPYSSLGWYKFNNTTLGWNTVYWPFSTTTVDMYSPLEPGKGYLGIEGIDCQKKYGEGYFCGNSTDLSSKCNGQGVAYPINDVNPGAWCGRPTSNQYCLKCN